ncbi:hypothetical protein KCX82_03690 [Clostridiales bacterium BAD-6]|uniref:Uncharacterized protein n=1 Tax=Sinanaerobacter chloroacetimidivorans TaxID=2818044 RepID=A0A8J8B274_9FIRM|nr:hypothetical protein [Sinanaerobacter chloroacetimidivorans]
MSDELKLNLLAALDKAGSKKEIQAQLKQIQNGLKIKVGLELDQSSLSKLKIDTEKSLQLPIDTSVFQRLNQSVNELKLAFNELNTQIKLDGITSQINALKSGMQNADNSVAGYLDRNVRDFGEAIKSSLMKTLVDNITKGVFPSGTSGQAKAAEAVKVSKTASGIETAIVKAAETAIVKLAASTGRAGVAAGLAGTAGSTVAGAGTSAGVGTLAGAASLLVPAALIVGGGILAYDLMTTSLKEQKEKVAETTAEYQLMELELDSLNTQLEGNQTRLREYNQDNLSLSEEEKQQLTEQNEQLERQIRSQETLAKIKLKESSKETIALLEYKTEKIKTGTKTYHTAKEGTITVDQFKKVTQLEAAQHTIDELKSLKEAGKNLEYQIQNLDESTDGYDGKLKNLKGQLENNNKAQDKSKSYLIETIQYLEEQSNQLDVSTESGKKYKEEIESLAVAADKMINGLPMEQAEEYYNIHILKNSEMVARFLESYNIDLTGFSTLLQLKMALENGYYSNISNIQDDIIDNLAEKYGVDLTNFKTKEEQKLAIAHAASNAITKMTGVASGYNREQISHIISNMAMAGKSNTASYKELTDWYYGKDNADYDNALSEINKLFEGFISSVHSPKSNSVFTGNNIFDKKSKEGQNQEDQIKILDSQYDSRLSLSKQYIEDRNFYNDWGADSEIAAWERIKAYTEDYYREGTISHEKYAESIREIDKNLYTARKESINQAYKGMQNAALKQLDSEKKALESRLDENSENYVNRKLDDNIKAAQEELDLLNEQAETEDRLLRIEKAKIALAKSQDQKTSRIYREGQGYVWEADQTAVSDAQSELDEMLSDWNKYQKKLDLESQIKDWEAAKEENEQNIRAQIKDIEQLSSVWNESLDLEEEITEYQGDLKALVGSESASYEERLALAQRFAQQYAAIMANLGGSSYTGSSRDSNDNKGYDVKAGKDGKAPSGLTVGTKVGTAGGTYQITGVKSDGSYTSIKIDNKKTYAQGGVADFTGLAQLDGSPTKAETIFNSTDSSKLYDLIHNNNTSDLAGMVLSNLIRPMPGIGLNSELPGSIHLSIGDIHVSGVQDANGFADAVIQQFPNTFIQKLYKR